MELLNFLIIINPIIIYVCVPTQIKCLIMHAGAGCWQADWLQESIFSALTGLTAAWHLAHQDLDNTWHLAHQDRTNRPLIPITPCTTPSPSPCHRSTTQEHNIREAQQSTSPPTAKTIPSALPGLPANQILSFLTRLVIGVIRSKK